MNTSSNGRPNQIWLMDLGYSSDSRYMDKVMEKRPQIQMLSKVVVFLGLLSANTGCAKHGWFCQCKHSRSKANLPLKGSGLRAVSGYFNSVASNRQGPGDGEKSCGGIPGMEEKTAEESRAWSKN
jgi:hypothetical protein